MRVNFLVMGSKRRTFWEAFETSALFIGVLFLVYFFEIVSPVPLRSYGILPRTSSGLVGVVFSPLLHENWQHLMANAFPLFVVLVLLFWDQRYDPDEALMWIWVASGFGTWLIGRGDAIHIGASSIIYGLVAYLIAAGWWIQSWRTIIVAILVIVFYGGIASGILPQRSHISWEGHLAGAVAGWWVAWKNHG